MDSDTINQEIEIDQTTTESSVGSVQSEVDPSSSAPDVSSQSASNMNPDTVQTPDFNEMVESPEAGKGTPELNRLNEVRVTVAAELGRTNLPIQELLKLSEGSVVELNRSIESPVEIIAQGLPLANGEVVVVDEKFAIRIKEVYSNS